MSRRTASCDSGRTASAIYNRANQIGIKTAAFAAHDFRRERWTSSEQIDAIIAAAPAYLKTNSEGDDFKAIAALDSAIWDIKAKLAGEPLWRMPLVEDYEERLESKVADADNAAGGPGAITAALFLRHFTAGLPWAHLDIASVGDSPVDAFEWTSGATGFGARALLHWLELREPLAGVTA